MTGYGAHVPSKSWCALPNQEPTPNHHQKNSGQDWPNNPKLVIKLFKEDAPCLPRSHRAPPEKRKPLQLVSSTMTVPKVVRMMLPSAYGNRAQQWKHHQSRKMVVERYPLPSRPCNAPLAHPSPSTNFNSAVFLRAMVSLVAAATAPAE
jgi:hypothetical protein